ncbi:hypothetical protein PAHAL_2G147900 [Panicum hallii]|uniref:Uncharacterized protein n=1 Tax=Panicum hallii TaxID=206008 RepID=A0A2T8KP71_9POAL|nr:hypothetical protein PAHAL_2G147900 [Panicum hallii]
MRRGQGANWGGAQAPRCQCSCSSVSCPNSSPSPSTAATSSPTTMTSLTSSPPTASTSPSSRARPPGPVASSPSSATSSSPSSPSRGSSSSSAARRVDSFCCIYNGRLIGNTQRGSVPTSANTPCRACMFIILEKNAEKAVYFNSARWLVTCSINII